MNAHYQFSDRTRFMLRRGVLPWGFPAGVAAAFAAFMSVADADTISTLGIVALCLFCFGLWTALVGWAVGEFLWDLRSTDGRPVRARRPPRR